MTTDQTIERNSRAPLRLWPGVAIATAWLVLRLGAVAAPDATLFGLPLAMLAVLGGIAGGLAIVAWWVCFSRAPWPERLGAIVVMAVALLATYGLVHESISNGMMGMMLPVFTLPLLGLALVASAVAGRRLSSGPRRATMVAAILLACAVMTLVRTGGVTGDGDSDLHWRWTPTPEERLLAQAGALDPETALGGARDAARATPSALPAGAPAVETPEKKPAPHTAEPAAPPPTAAASESHAKPALAPASDGPPDAPRSASTAIASDSARVTRDAEWPGFRGPGRDSIVRGVRIQTDWTRTPPVELWRRPIGPGWSSFAVDGDLLYTQEQRGEHEIVACYKVSTGEPVWQHRDAVRFWESNGGAGPRATPTVHDGRVYTMGATGIVNALDAESGALLWSRNAATDTSKTIPDWGIASSPLVIDDLVIVAVAGQLAAYDAATGSPRWIGQTGGGGYSSPHLATIDGVRQVLLLRGARTISVAPADGTLLWEHSSGQPSVSIVQPVLAEGGGVLIAAGDAMGGNGMRRLAVAHGPGGWTVEERWTSRGLKPYFNDSVLHQGHAFGFDGSILACIDLADGTRTWKGGRYGHGQLVLLPDQDLLLVLSEDGELALVKAAPDKFTQIARVKALEGKTWNHPVLVGDLLLVRNGEEMAAYRLPLAGS